MIKNCYIHIPFCKKICSYCDFCKLYYDKKFISNYLVKLRDEINNKYRGEVLDTIYIGGGTPSCLAISELEELFDILSILKKNKNIEYTIEANIDSIDKDKILLFVKNGINRISIGIESVNKDNLLFLERDFNKEECISKINMIKELGINNINLDLMYALPNEDINMLNDDLDFIIKLKPQHISTYSLIIEDHTKLGINNISNISDDIDDEMYKVICKKLRENNYNHYEISNFSKEGYYSRHNMCYWENKEYYGFGLGASFYLDNKRGTYTRSISKFPSIVSLEDVEIEDKIEYEIILGLRLLRGINLIEFKKKYNNELKDIYDYSELVNSGFLIEEDNYLRIPEEKIYVSNEIIVKVLEKKK